VTNIRLGCIHMPDTQSGLSGAARIMAALLQSDDWQSWTEFAPPSSTSKRRKFEPIIRRTDNSMVGITAERRVRETSRIILMAADMPTSIHLWSIFECSIFGRKS
jgi:hypothetical protein